MSIYFFFFFILALFENMQNIFLQNQKLQSLFAVRLVYFKERKFCGSAKPQNAYVFAE